MPAQRPSSFCSCVVGGIIVAAAFTYRPHYERILNCSTHLFSFQHSTKMRWDLTRMHEFPSWLADSDTAESYNDHSKFIRNGEYQIINRSIFEIRLAGRYPSAKAARDAKVAAARARRGTAQLKANDGDHHDDDTSVFDADERPPLHHLQVCRLRQVLEERLNEIRTRSDQNK